MRSSTKQGNSRTGKGNTTPLTISARKKRQKVLSTIAWTNEKVRREKFGDKAMFCVGGRYVAFNKKAIRQEGAKDEKHV